LLNYKARSSYCRAALLLQAFSENAWAFCCWAATAFSVLQQFGSNRHQDRANRSSAVMKMRSQETVAGMQFVGMSRKTSCIECSCRDLSHEVILLMCGRSFPACFHWQTCASS
jgi:hypothetical protein